MKKKLNIISWEDQLAEASRRLDLQAIERLCDLGLRHKSGVIPVEYRDHFLKVFRAFGFDVTQDQSWGELEKLIAIAVKTMIRGGIWPKGGG